MDDVAAGEDLIASMAVAKAWGFRQEVLVWVTRVSD